MVLGGATEEVDAVSQLYPAHTELELTTAEDDAGEQSSPYPHTEVVLGGAAVEETELSMTEEDAEGQL